MEGLFPLLFIIFVWSLIGSSIRRAVKGSKGRQQSEKKHFSAGPEKTPMTKTRSRLQSSPSGSSHQHAVSGWGSLGSSESEGSDPCHDDPLRIPSGSLNVTGTEGTDPCHDNPYGMPLGSLAVDHPEGTDPCHPSLRADQPESGIGPKPEVSGLNLRFGGSDIVQGFVWGEILNRKRA